MTDEAREPTTEAGRRLLKALWTNMPDADGVTWGDILAIEDEARLSATPSSPDRLREALERLVNVVEANAELVGDISIYGELNVAAEEARAAFNESSTGDRHGYTVIERLDRPGNRADGVRESSTGDRPDLAPLVREFMATNGSDGLYDASRMISARNAIWIALGEPEKAEPTHPPFVPSAPPSSPDRLREALVAALKEAAEEEARAWTSDKRPVVGTWGDRILAAFARHGLRAALNDSSTGDRPEPGRRDKPDGWHTYHICGGLRRELISSGGHALCVVCGEWFDASAALRAEPTYEDRVQGMADALHEDCLNEWSAIAAVDPGRALTMHAADTHYGRAHDLVRRLFSDLEP